ncbi:hypothetical protein [Persephonella sp.]|uniref:DUF7132 family protein n=1 Tax=Persephonella sp. TaxID=2060922 RepID=UPI00260D1898|nr:hypothetical protein [Persephonella sp.]
MEPIKQWDIELELVKTKTGALLYKINVADNHFFLEQNPLKDSKYGVAYRKLKEKYPEFYMFWEIKNNRYTGRLLTGTFLEKEDIDRFITDVLQSEEYKQFEDVKEEIEKQ